MKALVVFDVDGTLTASNEIDSLLYVQALREVFGFDDVDDDWSHYRNTTDPGILEELFEIRLGRQPSVEESNRFRQRFCGLVRQALVETPGFSPEIPGAGALMDQLRQRGILVALASGAYRCSVEAKLAAGGLKLGDIPWATGDDAVSRVEILRIAIAVASQGVTTGPALLVGDAIWDFRAAQELGLPVLLVAQDKRAMKLKEAGAEWVVPNFLEAGPIFEFLSAGKKRTAGFSHPRSRLQ